MATLTLIDGEAQQAFEEHPTEVARKALLVAAEHEEGLFADQLREFADTFPVRALAEGGV